jgi:hypothetical protein
MTLESGGAAECQSRSAAVNGPDSSLLVAEIIQ